MPRFIMPDDERCKAHVNDGTFSGHRCSRPKAEGDAALCKQHRAGENRSSKLAEKRMLKRELRQSIAQDLSLTLGAAFFADPYKDELHISLASAEQLLIRIKMEGLHIDA